MKSLSKLSKSLFVLGAVAFGAVSMNLTSTPLYADGHSKAAMKDVVGVAMGSKDHTTLVTAVKAADLVGTLQGKGPFTVFAPTNGGFDKLPDGTVADLLKAENKSTLSSILTYHVVAGKFPAADVMKLVNSGQGKATVKTVQGGTLTVMPDGDKGLMIMDEKGGKAKITATDLMGSNGVIHVIDTVLMPK